MRSNIQISTDYHEHTYEGPEGNLIFLKCFEACVF